MRKYGVLLYFLADIDSPRRFSVMAKVSELLSNEPYYLTTQEIAWSIMGIGKVLKKMNLSDTNAVVLVNGEKVKKFLKKGGSFILDNYKGQIIEISNKGSSPVYAVVKIIGRKASYAFTPVDNGISIKREYFNLNGVPVGYENGSYLANLADGLIVKLTINSNIGKVYNLAISDRIPAGFEIENTRLDTSSNLFLKKADFVPDYVDIRDDRINIFGSLTKQSAVYYYMIRAVNRGKYNLPPVKAELMYRPKIRSIKDKGFFIVN